MKPLPPPIMGGKREEPTTLFLTTARSAEAIAHLCKYLRVNDDLPDAETFKERYYEHKTYMPIEPYSLQESGFDHLKTSTYKVTRYKRRESIIYGQIIYGWEKLP